jgi:hypothetical protein
MTDLIVEHTRHTIMDGDVVTLSMRRAGDPHEPFEVSASRNGVVIHRAHCKSDGDIDLLIVAIGRARKHWRELAAKN